MRLVVPRDAIFSHLIWTSIISSTVCPKSSDPFHTVSYYIKGVTSSYPYSETEILAYLLYYTIQYNRQKHLTRSAYGIFIKLFKFGVKARQILPWFEKKTFKHFSKGKIFLGRCLLFDDVGVHQLLRESTCWVHEYMLSTWVHVEYTSSCWVHEYMLSTWVHVEYMSTCWVHDYMLSTWVHVENMSTCWVHEYMLSTWVHVEGFKKSSCL